MLEKLNWHSLEQRRADSRLAMLYKMANSLVAIDASPLLVPMEGIQHSAHPHRYVVPTTRTVLHQNSFFPRTIRQWNSLSSSVAQASSLDAFKHQVSRLQHWGLLTSLYSFLLTNTLSTPSPSHSPLPINLNFLSSSFPVSCCSLSLLLTNTLTP